MLYGDLRLADFKKAKFKTILPYWQSSKTYLSHPARQLTTISVRSVCDDYVHKLSATPTALADETTNNVNDPTSIQKIYHEKSTDDLYKKDAPSIRRLRLLYSANPSGFPICQAFIDGAIQKVVPKSLQARFPFLFHHPVAPHYQRHHVEFNTLRCNYYWPHMAYNTCQLVEKCAECRKARENNRHQRQLKIFPGCDLLDPIVMDILVQMPKEKNWNQLDIVMTDRYSNLTRTIPLSNTTVLHASLTFIDRWIIPKGVPNCLLADNVP